MAIFLNPDNNNFRENLASKIYVDKSLIVHELNQIINTNDKYVCISRPRRFGKSMAGNLISAYYSKGADSKELFKGLKLATTPDFESNLNKFNVIKIDINGCFQNKSTGVSTTKYFTNKVIAELKEYFNSVDIEENATLPDALMNIYSETKEQFIILLDEYDVLVREKCPKEEFEEYLSFLNGMFKNADLQPAIALAYVTGILPIVRDKIQSKLNNFDEYTMTGARQLTEFAGFTESEVKELCTKYKLDFEECKRWYNGYEMTTFNEDFMPCNMSLYSPRSLVCAIQNHRFGDYWTKTSSYEALSNYINVNYEGIKDDIARMMGGAKVKVDVLTYLNTMTDFKSKDDVFTYLIHLGYLAYDIEKESCYIPNSEVRNEWVVALKNTQGYETIVEMLKTSDDLLEATLEMDEKAVEEALDKAHSLTMNNMTYNKENCFQSAIILAYYTARADYTIITELPGGKGYADVVFIPYRCEKPALIIELKNSAKAADQTALEQIKNKKYFDALESYKGNMLLIGVSYNPDTKEHSCKIEEMSKTSGFY